MYILRDIYLKKLLKFNSRQRCERVPKWLFLSEFCSGWRSEVAEFKIIEKKFNDSLLINDI